MITLHENSIPRKIENELEGYSLDIKLSSPELEYIRQLISRQWLEVIDGAAPDLAEQFKKNGIENYHLMSDLLHHNDIWKKSARIFTQASINGIRNLDFMKRLADIFGDFTISDDENSGYGEIYWRLVRPFASDDVGPMHADCWFYDLGHGTTPSNTKRVKVWIPIYSEPGLNGLYIVPGSHVREWIYSGEMRDGFVKPQFNQSQVDLPIILAETKPGEVIIFNDRLLHKGALNQGKKTRVSIEFMLFIDQNRFNHYFI